MLCLELIRPMLTSELNLLNKLQEPGIVIPRPLSGEEKEPSEDGEPENEPMHFQAQGQ